MGLGFKVFFGLGFFGGLGFRSLGFRVFMGLGFRAQGFYGFGVWSFVWV